MKLVMEQALIGKQIVRVTHDGFKVYNIGRNRSDMYPYYYIDSAGVRWDVTSEGRINVLNQHAQDLYLVSHEVLSINEAYDNLISSNSSDTTFGERYVIENYGFVMINDGKKKWWSFSNNEKNSTLRCIYNKGIKFIIVDAQGMVVTTDKLEVLTELGYEYKMLREIDWTPENPTKIRDYN